MHRLTKCLIVLFSFMALSVPKAKASKPPADAHKFYVSITQVHWNEKRQRLEITKRLFIDDLQLALQNKFGGTFHIGSNLEASTEELKFIEYISEMLKIQVNAKPYALQFVSKVVEDDVLVSHWVIQKVTKINTIEVSNRTFFNVLPEQQNIIHTRIKSDKKSLLLTFDHPQKMLKF